MFRIASIPADGIGREVVASTLRVLQVLNPAKYGSSNIIHLPAGFELFQQTGDALPQSTIDQVSQCNAALFGAVSSPSHKVAGYSSPIVRLRKVLDLYANVRPVKSTHSNIDMLILRENTECLYVKEEREFVDTSDNKAGSGMKVAEATRRITEFASRRIGRMALDQAVRRYRQRLDNPASSHHSSSRKAKVTVVHKSNVMSITDGLFRESVLSEYKLNADYHDKVEVEEQLVDSMVYRLFREPHAFDVIVAPNLYGDIVSDAAAALVGSLGMVAGANVGDKFVMGEPVHGSAPDIAGKGIANPIACIRSAALMLDLLGESQDATRLGSAVDTYLANGSPLTPDMGGNATTDSVTAGIVAELNSK